MLAKRTSARDNTFLIVTLAVITDLKKIIHSQTQQLTFLNLVLRTPPHLKYVATLPCNLSLMACFANINVSQGSVATYARCGGIFNIQLTTNLPRNLPVNYF